MSRLTRPVIVTLAALLLTAGCAGSRTGHLARPGSALSAPVVPAGTGSDGSAPGGPSSPAGTAGGHETGPVPASRCPVRALRLRLDLTGGGMGGRYASLEVTNASAAPCSVGGFVDLQRYDRSGRPLPTRVVREGSVPTPVTLAPGRSAWATIAWTMIPGTGEDGPDPCQPATEAFDVLVPPAGPARRVAVSAGGICEGGRLTVGPLTTRPPVQRAGGAG